MKPNLLITYAPAHPGKAEKEVRAILEGFGGCEFFDASIPGVFLVYAENPKHIVRHLRGMDRSAFETTFKWIPIDKWVKTDIREIADIMKEYNNMIGENESWRISVFKRGYKEKGIRELIQLLTENIYRENVSLDNPDKIIVVEIFGSETGLSLLENQEYLDVNELSQY